MVVGVVPRQPRCCCAAPGRARRRGVPRPRRARARATTRHRAAATSVATSSAGAALAAVTCDCKRVLVSPTAASMSALLEYWCQAHASAPSVSNAAGRDHAAVQPRALPLPALVGAGQARLRPAPRRAAAASRSTSGRSAGPAATRGAPGRARATSAPRARSIGEPSCVALVKYTPRNSGAARTSPDSNVARTISIIASRSTRHCCGKPNSAARRSRSRSSCRRAIRRFVQRLLERDQFAGQARQAGRHVGVRIQRQGGAPHLRAFVLVEVGEELGEAGQQVALGDHHIDRKADAELAVQLLDALAHLARQHAALVGIGLQQVGGAQAPGSRR